MEKRRLLGGILLLALVLLIVRIAIILAGSIKAKESSSYKYVLISGDEGQARLCYTDRVFTKWCIDEEGSYIRVEGYSKVK